MEGKLRNPRLGRELAALGERQHGVVAHWQLRGIGLEERGIERRLWDGRLHGIHRDVYAVGHRRLGQRGWWWAAVLAYGPDALLSHRSAAAYWGLWRPRGPVDVTAPMGWQGALRRKGIWIHRCKISPEDRAAGTDIPVTTVARTIFDFAEIAKYRHVQSIAEEADRLKLLQVKELEQVCERGRGRRALKPIRRLLAELSTPTEGRSPLEERFHAFCRAHGLPEPERNVDVLGLEVDALWPTAKLAVELDSWEFHGHRAAFERDRARDPKLLLAGYRTVRVTHRRLNREADQLAAEIRELLRAGG
jgi:predicted transcriptional regulator of viral defense system